MIAGVLGGHERLTGFVGKQSACVGHRFIAGAGFVLFPRILNVLLNVLLLPLVLYAQVLLLGQFWQV